MDARFLAFLTVAVVLIVTPGPDTAMVTRNAFRGGARGASLTALGVSLGIVAWGAASAAGLAAALAASATAFHAVTAAGAVALAGLGLRSLHSALRGTGEASAAANPAAVPAFVQGLLGNLLNPKAGAIFLSVVPQFVRPGDPALRLAAMVLAFALMVCAWLLLYGWLVARARLRFGRWLRRALAGLTGAVLVGLGVRLAAESF